MYVLVMEEQLVEWIKVVRNNKDLQSFDEAKTKQTLILKVLKILGWDIHDNDELCVEDAVGKKRVDYSLKFQKNLKVFIEVKKVGITDLENDVDQLLFYSVKKSVGLAVLTNGISWWFYLPLIHKEDWEQRKFCSIEILDQDLKSVVKNFVTFLSKENVVSGNAIKNAENLIKSKEKDALMGALMEEYLPKAWDKILKESNPVLINLIADTTEKLCGNKPTNKIVKGFIETNISSVHMVTIPHPSLPRTIRRNQLPQKGSDLSSLTGTKPATFIFKGNRKSIVDWSDLLVNISELMLNLHKSDFPRVLQLRGRKKPYFSKTPDIDEFINSKPIGDSSVSVETCLNANQIRNRSYEIIALFGHRKDDLKIEIREPRKN